MKAEGSVDIREQVLSQGDGAPGQRSWVADVIVVPKEGVNDPEGEAILGGLRSLGYAGVGRVRAGRFIQLTLTAGDAQTAGAAVAAMCDQLLANPVIETYHVDVSEVVPEDALSEARA